MTAIDIEVVADAFGVEFVACLPRNARCLFAQ